MSDLPPPPPSFGAPQFQPPSSGRELSGWWRRAGAIVIDGLIIGVCAVVLVVVLGAAAGEAGVVLAIIAIIAGVVAYDVVLHATSGQTVGKMATGIKVVPQDAPDAPLGWGKAWGRWGAEFGIGIGLNVLGAFGALGVLLSFVGSILLYLWPLWDADKQTWYDKAAGTIVVRT